MGFDIKSRFTVEECGVKHTFVSARKMCSPRYLILKAVVNR